METIRNYIDTMFKNLPKTKEVVDLKLNILDAMEDKYNELINDGKSEHEAIGMVISQFGNIDEVKQELGIKQETDQDITGYYVSTQELKEYLSFQKRFGVNIALGVTLCILSVLFPIFAYLKFANNNYDTTFVNVFGIGGFFLMIGIAVVLFIIYGTKNIAYNHLKQQALILSSYDRADLKIRYKKFISYYYITVAIGVSLCILTVASIAILYLNQSEQFITYNLLLLVLPIAIAVYLFIYYGVIYTSLRLFLNNEDYHGDMVMGMHDDKYFSLTMPLAAMIFLFIGFVFGTWHPTWIIFPATAIATSFYARIRES